MKWNLSLVLVLSGCAGHALPALDEDRSFQEASIINALRAFTMLNELHYAGNRFYAPELRALEGYLPWLREFEEGCFDPEQLELERDYLSPSFEDRFKYALNYCSTGQNWSISASPLRRGLRSFFVDQCGLIRFSRDNLASESSEELGAHSVRR